MRKDVKEKDEKIKALENEWETLRAMMREQAQGNDWAETRLEILGMRYVDGLTAAEITAQTPTLTKRQIYRMISAGREQFRRSLIAVIASYHPDLSYQALEERCRNLLELL